MRTSWHDSVRQTLNVGFRPRLAAGSSCSALRRLTSASLHEPAGLPYQEAPGARSLGAFNGLSLRESVLAGIRRSFPRVNVPTDAQRVFIPAVVRGGQDVFLRDRAGAGKSFGLVLALLSQNRGAHKQQCRRAITSLLIVPHAPLAQQLMDWVLQLTPESLVETLPTVAQLLVRGDRDNTLEQQVHRLQASPPQIVVATPQALLDVWQAAPEVLQVRGLRTIVADEADYMLGFSSSSAKTATARGETERSRPLHPPPLMDFLDDLFHKRAKIQPRIVFDGAPLGVVPLQLVLSSATFPPRLREFLVHETQWVADPADGAPIVEVGFSQADVGDIEDRYLPPGVIIGGPGLAQPELVKHYCLLSGGVRGVTNFAPGHIHAPPETTTRKQAYHKVQQGRLLPSSDVLESIATVFAMEVSRLALLVVEAQAPVHRIVEEFRKLGVDARPLNLGQRGQRDMLRATGHSARTSPATLLVSTRASTRGIDLPISHVFILGAPENAVAYRHLAGRVGRRGAEGSVVTIVEASKDEGLVADMYSRLGVVLTAHRAFSESNSNKF